MKLSCATIYFFLSLFSENLGIAFMIPNIYPYGYVMHRRHYRILRIDDEKETNEATISLFHSREQKDTNF